MDLIADVAGYYLSGAATRAGTFVPVAPTRFLDSRIPQGTESTPVPGHTPTSVQVLATGAVPATNVGAAVVNVTATEASTSGYLTAYPMGTTKPTASNLNFVTDVTRANAAILAPGTCGQLTIYNGASSYVQLIGDVSGYFLADDVTPPVTPAGTVHGWGTEGQGILGNGVFSYPGTLSPVTALGVSGRHVAVRASGPCWPWAATRPCRAGDPTSTASWESALRSHGSGAPGLRRAVDVPGLTWVTAIAGGDRELRAAQRRHRLGVGRQQRRSARRRHSGGTLDAGTGQRPQWCRRHRRWPIRRPRRPLGRHGLGLGRRGRGRARRR